MEDEYKVVCALSNSAAFDDLEWPRTPVSRSQYSLKANISQTVHPIHSMFGSRQGFLGSADRITGSIKSKVAADGHLEMTALSRVTLASAGLSCLFLIKLARPTRRFLLHTSYITVSHRICMNDIWYGASCTKFSRWRSRWNQTTQLADDTQNVM